jgi:hypothetical protein
MPLAVSLIFRPYPGLLRLKNQPRWLSTFICLAALSAVLLVVVHRHTVEATLAQLPVSATTEDRALVEDMLLSELPLRSLFQPIRLMIGWSSFAALLFLLSRAFRPPSPSSFMHVFALEIHAEAILLLSQIGLCLHIVLQGRGLPSAYPLWSADIFSSAATSMPIHSLLRSLNIFTLWYIVILAAGIRVLFSLSRFKSVLVAVSAFSLSVVLDIGVISLLIPALHLHV